MVPDETAKKIFTPAKLEGIGRMIHFVDSIVLKETGLTDINGSYHAYMDRVDADFRSENITPFLNESAEFQFLETINNDAFSAIWREFVIYSLGSTIQKIQNVCGILSRIVIYRRKHL